MTESDATLTMEQLPISTLSGGRAHMTLVQRGAFAPPSVPGSLGRIERFEVLGLLGEGGMGLVYLACDPVDNAKVAVKIMKTEVSDDPRSAHRFLGEARHMGRLSHPHILRVLEVADRKEGPYYVMPYAEGGSLLKQYQPGLPMPTERILPVARQVADALAYAHTQGVIHRDIKPGNILLDGDGNALLTDFGLVRTVFNDSMVDVTSNHLEGTAPYMSPAVANGEAEDTRCDIYAFGAVLYELLTGQPPYMGHTAQAVLDQVLKGPPSAIRAVNPGADPGLSKIAERCMARELRDRYASMRNVVADLYRLAVPPSLLDLRQRQRNLRLRAVALFVITLAAGVLAAVALLRTQDRNVPLAKGVTVSNSQTRVLARITVTQAVFPVASQPLKHSSTQALSATVSMPKTDEQYLLVQERSQITEVKPSGETKVVCPFSGMTSVLDDELFVYQRAGANIDVYGLLGDLKRSIKVPQEIKYSTALVVLPDKRIAILANRNDTIYFLDEQGNLLKTVPILDKPDNHMQNLDGIVVGNRLIVSENGNREIISVDLSTYEVRLFRKLDQLGGWLGAITCISGTYYICQSRDIYAFTETDSNITKVATVPEGNITGITYLNGKLFTVVNGASRERVDNPRIPSKGDSNFGVLYEIDPQNGRVLTIKDGLGFPRNVLEVKHPKRKKAATTLSNRISRMQDMKPLTLGDYSYVTNAAGEATIIDFNNYKGELCVTNMLGGHPVVGIGFSAFKNCDSLTRVAISQGITNISSRAFHNCTNLVSFSVDPSNTAYACQDGVLFNKDLSALIRCPAGKEGEYKVPLSVTSIQVGAFESCAKLTGMTLHTRVGDIQNDAFLGCKQLTRIDIPSGVTNVGFGAFQYCTNLVALTLPAGVVQFNPNVVDGCSRLASIFVDPSNPVFTSLDGVLFDKQMATLILCPEGKAGTYTVPRTVVRIGTTAFRRCDRLTHIDLPAGLADIHNSAFSGCRQLAQIDIPSSVTNIGSFAFQSCTNLTELALPANLIQFAPSAVNGCSNLKLITVDPANHVFASEDGVLYDSAKTNIVVLPQGRRGTLKLPAAFKRIKSGAFAGTRFSSVALADGTADIPFRAFSGCSYLIEVALPSSVTNIASSAFEGCEQLTSITIPPNVIAIREQAFLQTGLTRLILPFGVKTIERFAFEGCTNLTEVSVSASVTNLDVQAFSGCNSLTSITVNATNPVYSSRDFTLLNKEQNRIVLVPEGKKGRYEIPAGIVAVESAKFLFSGTLQRRSVTTASSRTLPPGLTRLGEPQLVRLPPGLTPTSASVPNGLEACTGLTEIAIPASVTNLGENAFAGCKNLTSLTVHATNLCYSARDGLLFDKAQTRFLFCPRGKTGCLAVPNGVIEIGAEALKHCQALTDIAIPASVTNIDDGAFYCCTNLTSIKVSESNPVYSSRDGVLFDKARTRIIKCPEGKKGNYAIPLGVRQLLNHYAKKPYVSFNAFDSCARLTDISIPGTVTNIDIQFVKCNNMTSITVAAENPSYSSRDGILFNKAQTDLLSYPRGKMGAYVIPTGTLSVTESAFAGCALLPDVTIPDSVTNVRSRAFYNCANLTNVVFPAKLPDFGVAVFDWCAHLPSDTIPDSAKRTAMSRSTRRILPRAAVPKPEFESVTNSGAVTITQYNGPGGEVVVPSLIGGLPVTTIADNAFNRCANLVSVSLPASVTSIESNPFDGRAKPGTLLAFTVDAASPAYWSSPDGVLFSKDKTSLIVYPDGRGSDYVIPKGVTCICNGAFHQNPNLTGVTIPDTVTNIMWGAFVSCANLNSINLPASVRTIVPYAFANCYKLASINVDKENPTYCSDDGVLFNKTKTSLISCPGGRSGSYAIPGTVTHIAGDAFNGCTNLTQILIPEGVSQIDNAAFARCSRLTGIDLPSSVRRLGQLVFCDSGLTSVKIPNGVSAIEWESFWGCGALTNVVIPASVTRIDGNAFRYCGALTSLTIPASVTVVGGEAFVCCPKLTGLYFKGDAPGGGADNSIFGGTQTVTVYYLPGTKGWGPTFGGRPTKEWKQ